MVRPSHGERNAAEVHARGLGIPLTIVRASAYLELWIEILQQTARRSGRPIVFGRGNNPINFVSVKDVADVVDQAVTDPTVRDRTLEVTGPQSLTMTQLAAAVQLAEGRTAAPRHIPRAVLQVAAHTVGRVQPAVAQLVRAALAMDQADFAAGPSILPENYPNPSTTAATVVDRLHSSNQHPASPKA